MKTQTITIPTSARPDSRGRLMSLVHRADSLPCLAFVILVSAIPPIGLVILATWASNLAVGLPVIQAATALGGLVFLALALESDRKTATASVATAIALFTLAWASMTISPDLVIVGSMVIAAWAGIGLFSRVRQRCL